MPDLGVMQFLTVSGGRQIMSIRPDALRTAIKAAMTAPETAKIADKPVLQKAVEPGRDREP